ncbi:MAG: hypothetical protein MAG715_00210 [Methanonatronarchaeales archaeon]|nr:hypothetical protein [Methanonatronarchaeales archaeon]
MNLASTAFEEGETIPERYTCDGADVSPPLDWTGVPDGAESLTLLVNDPDAPGGTFTHWVTYDLPPGKDGLDEGGDGGAEGANDFGGSGYGGPCPPPGSPHRYRFRLYALDAKLGLPDGVSKTDAIDAMEGHVLAEARLTGTYGR